MASKPAALTTNVKPVLAPSEQEILPVSKADQKLSKYLDLQADIKFQPGIDSQPDIDLQTGIESLGNTLTPDDTFARQQWSLQSDPSIDGSSGLFSAYNYLTGSYDVVVAVVDSGVIQQHEDLNFLPGYDFIHTASVGNDGDGRDHDPSDPGDWVNRDDIDQQTVGEGCAIAASKWHGTAIAGIIGATAYNATGIAGGSPAVSMLPVRVTGKCGGYVTDLIDGIRWAAGLQVSGVADNPYPAQVINLSVGFPGACSNAMQQAIDDATDAGAILVTAATNSAADLDIEPYSPASCNNVLTVAATDRAGAVTAYTARGDSVFISAPGGTASDGIITTQNDGSELPLAGSYYGYHYGTSIAAAHVSAAVANLLSFEPGLKQAEIRYLLAASATSISSDPRCQSDQCGAGRLNALAAMELLASDPSDNEFSRPDPAAATVQLAAASSTNINEQSVVTTTESNDIRIGATDWQSLLTLLLLLLLHVHLKRRA